MEDLELKDFRKTQVERLMVDLEQEDLWKTESGTTY